MKKFLLSIVLFAGLGLSATAQKEGAVNKISIGPEFIYPLQNFEDTFKTKIGYGISVQGEYNILKNLNITGAVGLSSFAYKDEVKAFEESLGMPTSNFLYYTGKLGAKYYYRNFYATAEIGGALAVDYGFENVLAYSGGLGTSFSVSPKSSLDFGVRYEEWNLNGRYPFVGLRAAYSFGF